MATRSTLRASDQDREHVADRLRRAAGEGRLGAEELEERLEKVFSARTYGQLSVLTADLPAARESHRHNLPLWARASVAVALVLGVMMAIAIAAALLVALVCLWAVWVALSWSLFGRGSHARRVGRSRELARAARQTRAIFVPRGGRGTL